MLKIYKFYTLSALKTSFEGEYQHKLDKKLRVSVPSSWRPTVGGTYGLRLLKWEVSGIPVIKALTDEAFTAAIQSIQENPDLTNGMKSRQKGVLHTHNQPVSVNEQGKMLIPKKFALDQGLEPDASIYLLGRGSFFEILNTQNYQSMMEKESEVFTALYETIDFG